MPSKIPSSSSLWNSAILALSPIGLISLKFFVAYYLLKYISCVASTYFDINLDWPEPTVVFVDLICFSVTIILSQIYEGLQEKRPLNDKLTWIWSSFLILSMTIPGILVSGTKINLELDDQNNQNVISYLLRLYQGYLTDPVAFLNYSNVIYAIGVANFVVATGVAYRIGHKKRKYQNPEPSLIFVFFSMISACVFVSCYMIINHPLIYSERIFYQLNAITILTPSFLMPIILLFMFLSIKLISYYSVNSYTKLQYSGNNYISSAFHLLYLPYLALITITGYFLTSLVSQNHSIVDSVRSLPDTIMNNQNAIMALELILSAVLVVVLAKFVANSVIWFYKIVVAVIWFIISLLVAIVRLIWGLLFKSIELITTALFPKDQLLKIFKILNRPRRSPQLILKQITNDVVMRLICFWQGVTSSTPLSPQAFKKHVSNLSLKRIVLLSIIGCSTVGIGSYLYFSPSSETPHISTSSDVDGERKPNGNNTDRKTEPEIAASGRMKLTQNDITPVRLICSSFDNNWQKESNHLLEVDLSNCEFSPQARTLFDCATDSLIAVGAASASGDRNSEETRAQDRGNSLADRLSALYDQECYGKKNNRSIYVLNLGQPKGRQFDSKYDRKIEVLKAPSTVNSKELEDALREYFGGATNVDSLYTTFTLTRREQ